MIRPRLERYKKHFVQYFQQQVIAAEFDPQEHLVVYANPYLDFEQLTLEICEGLFDTVDFPDHLVMHLYPFGANHYVRIAINPIS